MSLQILALVLYILPMFICWFICYTAIKTNNNFYFIYFLLISLFPFWNIVMISITILVLIIEKLNKNN